MNGWKRERQSTWKSVVKLIGHMACTALVFLVLLAFVWVTDWTFEALNSVHPFQPEVRIFMGKLSRGFLYLDALTCGIVLLAGFFNFVHELLER